MGFKSGPLLDWPLLLVFCLLEVRLQWDPGNLLSSMSASWWDLRVLLSTVHSEARVDAPTLPLLTT